MTDEPSVDPATILIIEDDASLNAALAATLKAAGYRPIRAKDAAEGLRWFAHYGPDLVLLDLGLPDRDGLTVIREIRNRADAPIVVLSARGDESVKVEALDLGADDYVQKPFGVEELLARVRTGLRHAVQMRGSPPVVRAGDLTLDLGRRTVRRGESTVVLTPKKYDILSELALNLDRPVTHKTLLATIWGDERADIQYLRVYMGQLRQKVGQERILSIPGVGYQLVSR